MFEKNALGGKLGAGLPMVPTRQNYVETLRQQMVDLDEKKAKITRLLDLLERNPDFQAMLNLMTDLY